MYRILDMWGHPLEHGIVKKKIDFVLSDSFMSDCHDASWDLDILNRTGIIKLGFPIYTHDIRRGQYLYNVIEYYSSGGVIDWQVDYRSDTLQVMYDWCCKYRRLYFSRHVNQAHADFTLTCHGAHNLSVLMLSQRESLSLFEYVYSV